MRRGPAALAVAGLVAFAPAVPEARAEDGAVVVTGFSSDDRQAGYLAMAVLHLQVWQTLRLPRPGAPPKIVYFDDSVTPTSHDEAEAIARTDQAPMALWGKAFAFKTGLALQTFLSIRPELLRKPEAAVWTVSVPGGSTVSVGLPSARYEFTPVSIPRGVTDKVGKFTDLPVYVRPDGKQRMGTLGAGFRAVKHQGDWAQVRVDGLLGWVHLPGLGRQRSDAVSFTGGLIRAMREDWPGVLAIMEPVARDAKLRTAVRVDALLLMSAAAAQLKSPDSRRSIALADEALKLAPLNAAAVKYACLARLAASDGSAGVREVVALLNSNVKLFAPGDPWVAGLYRTSFALLGREKAKASAAPPLMNIE